jgi:hypothetical protein
MEDGVAVSGSWRKTKTTVLFLHRYFERRGIGPWWANSVGCGLLAASSLFF